MDCVELSSTVGKESLYERNLNDVVTRPVSHQMIQYLSAAVDNVIHCNRNTVLAQVVENSNHDDAPTLISTASQTEGKGEGIAKPMLVPSTQNDHETDVRMTSKLGELYTPDRKRRHQQRRDELKADIKEKERMHKQDEQERQATVTARLRPNAASQQPQLPPAMRMNNKIGSSGKAIRPHRLSHVAMPIASSRSLHTPHAQLRGMESKDSILPTVEQFIWQLVQLSNVPVGTLMVTLVYFNRVKSRLQLKLYWPRYARHQVFLTCLIMAAKYVNDISPKNKHWARHATFNGFKFYTNEVNYMERQLLQLLDWDLKVKGEDLYKCWADYLTQKG